MELEEFLKSEGALVSFCRNMKKWFKNVTVDKGRIACINSFPWVSTIEGSDYWRSLYHKFYQLSNHTRKLEKTRMYYATHECLKPPKSFKAI